tara:strand:+ start:896 stop:1510 length:615 start_codon:yes stop_codon:yes gene_type:complete
MKKYIPLALTILASTYISSVSATEDNSWYVGALYSAQEIEGQSLDGRDFNTAGIIAGYQYNKYFSLETRFSKGTSGAIYDDWSSFDQSLDDSTTDIDYQGSILIKASYPVTDTFNVYATAGYTKTKIEQDYTVPIFDADFMVIGSESFNGGFTEDGFTYGLGLSFKVSDKFNIFTEYQILPDVDRFYDSSGNWDSINVGVSYTF